MMTWNDINPFQSTEQQKKRVVKIVNSQCALHALDQPAIGAAPMVCEEG